MAEQRRTKEHRVTQIFISYSRKDLKFVEGLASDLRNAGFEVWYDFLRLRGGERWRTEIQNAIKNSQYIIVVLSPDSVESEWVEREFLFASSLKRKVIPLLHRECSLPLNYIDLNYINVSGENYRRNFNKILEVLNAVEPASAGIRRSSGDIQTSPGSLVRPAWLPTWMPTLVLLLCLSLSAVAAVYWLVLQPALQNSDVDRDGMTDAEEIQYGCDPNKQDTDNDGLIDAKEKEWHTYCDRADSDYDNLSDGQEVLVWKTNPGDGDTDHDYIWDGEEALVRHTNPLVPDMNSQGSGNPETPPSSETALPPTAAPTLLTPTIMAPTPQPTCQSREEILPEKTLPWFNPPKVSGQSLDFNGNGPRVHVKAKLYVKDSNQIYANVFMAAQEIVNNQLGTLRAEGDTLSTLGSDFFVGEIVRPQDWQLTWKDSQEADVAYFDTDPTLDIFPGDNSPLFDNQPKIFGPVTKFEIIGDTMSEDIGQSGGYKTGVRITLKPLHFHVEEISSCTN